MKSLSIDIETYSETDLSKAGVYRYSEDPAFEILLFGVSIDDGNVVVYDLAQGEKIPAEILHALKDNRITKWAHNAMFERVCLSRYLQDKHLIPKGTYLSPEGWKCSMVWSAYMGFPSSLKQIGTVLELEKQKMTEGKELIKYFCEPCKPTKSNGGRFRNFPSDAPDKWKLFKLYNKRDVEVEMSIADKFKAHPVPDSVWEEYHLDQEINDRGILIDIEMVRSAIDIDTKSQEHISERLRELTGLPNPRSVAQMQSWLKANAIVLDSLGRKELAKAINDIPEPQKSVLKLWQQLAMSAVKKYKAMDVAVCDDGRLRGMFKFYGANRTGRFCLAEGTPVLVKTLEGTITEKPIENVRLDDLVFDGENWVKHDGVVYSGDKEVITWDGITATPEHEVFINDEMKVTLGEAKEKGLKLWKL